MILKNEAQAKAIQQTGDIAQFLQVRKAELSVILVLLALNSLIFLMLDIQSVH